MSYWVTINAFEFQSLLSPEDLEEARMKFGAKLKNDEARSWFSESGYQFEKICSAARGGYEYGLLLDDYCVSRAFADSELADFIAEVIKPGTYTVIEFSNEEDKWGFLVFHKEVYAVEYVALVDGVNIHDFIRCRNERRESPPWKASTYMEGI